MTIPNYTLPNEILVNIFSYFDLPQLCKVAHVSRGWKLISEDDFLWKNFYEILLNFIGIRVDLQKKTLETKAAFSKRNIIKFFDQESLDLAHAAFKATLCLYKLGLRDIEQLLSKIKKCSPQRNLFQYCQAVDELLILNQPGLGFELVGGLPWWCTKSYPLEPCFEKLSDIEDFEIAYNSLQEVFAIDMYQCSCNRNFVTRLAFHAATKGYISILEKLLCLIQASILEETREACIRQINRLLIKHEFISPYSALYPKIIEKDPTREDIFLYINAKRISCAVELLQEVEKPALRMEFISIIQDYKADYKGQIPES